MIINYLNDYSTIRNDLSKEEKYSFYHLHDQLSYVIVGMNKDFLQCVDESNQQKTFSLKFLIMKKLIRPDQTIFRATITETIPSARLQVQKIEKYSDLLDTLNAHNFTGFYHLTTAENMGMIIHDMAIKSALLRQKPTYAFEAKFVQKLAEKRMGITYVDNIDLFARFYLRPKNEALVALAMSMLNQHAMPVLIELDFKALSQSKRPVYLLQNSGLELKYDYKFYQDNLNTEKRVAMIDWAKFNFTAIFSHIHERQYSTMERNAELLFYKKFTNFEHIKTIYFYSQAHKDEFLQINKDVVFLVKMVVKPDIFFAKL